MTENRQLQAPFAEALEDYCRRRMVPFHTPGHKGGRGASPYQRELFGEALRRDLGLMYALDDLFQPHGALREAMALAAELYGAGRTFFSVNGTTACIAAMLLAVCCDGDEVIIPREAHGSVLNGLILCGAAPVYMESRFAAAEEVTLGPTLDSLQQAVAAHPRARAVVFTYPTYDGIAVDLPAMAAYAHDRGLLVLVDEAHGAHLAFAEALPPAALACGADCVAQSTHKLLGSVTQTSMLHCRKGFPYTDRVARAMALVQSTSPNYWLLASLDEARRQMAADGGRLVPAAVSLARRVRRELNAISGIRCFGREICAYDGVAAFDETKLTIDVAALGLDGAAAEKELRREGIEVELTAGHHVLALLTIGDDAAPAAALVRACRALAAAGGRGKRAAPAEPPLPQPRVVLTPRQAWQSAVRCVAFDAAAGAVSAETITFYPPGIPVLARGEMVTAAVLDYLRCKLAAGYEAHGAADGTLRTLLVIDDIHEK